MSDLNMADIKRIYLAASNGAPCPINSDEARQEYADAIQDLKSMPKDAVIDLPSEIGGDEFQLSARTRHRLRRSRRLIVNVSPTLEGLREQSIAIVKHLTGKDPTPEEIARLDAKIEAKAKERNAADEKEE